ALSKTFAILVGIACVWFAVWSFVAFVCYRGGSEKLALIEHMRTPTTSFEPGDDIRVEGTLMSAETVKAPHSGRPCLAALTRIRAHSHYRDSQDNWAHDYALLKEVRVGPPMLQIAVGERRLLVPLEQWSGGTFVEEDVQDVPAFFGATDAEIAATKAKLRGDFSDYSLAESTIDGGTKVFVAGKLEGPDMRLAADPRLGRVELFVGTHEQYVKEGVREGEMGHTLAFIFAPIGWVPLLALGVVVLVRRRAKVSPSKPS
ncbi:MAG: hypothetical protein JNK04_15460, partial [Myxococcales bacterium]|nr:hypothetical protein [Myxococcales bacterium]